jgi:2-dehydropantoate 2-reductase
MRIGIVGAGGVGGYLAVLLAGREHDVVVVDQGEHVKAIDRNGIIIHSRARGDLHARVAAYENPAGVGLVDLVFYCVKP